MIRSNIDVWFSFFLRMVVTIRTSKYAKAISITMQTKNAFSTGFGHLAHWYVDIF